MIKVLFLAERTSLPGGVVPPHGSGAHVAATIWGLRRSFDVLPVLADGGEHAESTLRRAKRVVPPRVRGLRQDLLLFRDDREFARRALAQARTFRPDIVYERGEYLAVAGRRIARALGVPHVLEVNGLADLDYRQYYRSLGEPLGAALERYKLRVADATVTVSPGLGRRLTERGAPAERLVIVPNTVDPELVGPRPRAATEGGPLVVGWIGHPMPWHRLDLLVEAARSVVDAVPATRFEIVGAGAAVDLLQAEVAGRGLAESFRFTGAVPRTELAKRLGGFDVGVIPGIPEYAFPVKLVELGALGVPVVAPRAASLDELVAPGVEYEPFEAGDARALSAALVGLLADREARARLGGALQAAVRERYTWDASAAALRELVERLVAARRR